MRFTLIRFWLRLTSLLVPRASRAEWLRDWRLELDHRIPPRAFGNVLRDARFARERSPRLEHVDSRFSTIFLVEALSLIAATLLWIGYTSSRPSALCGADLDRIAFVQRSYATMGVALSSVTWRLEQQLSQAEPFEGTASFRIRHGFNASAEVSRNFFDLLGVQPALGKTFDRDSPLESVIISWSLWQNRFHGDPHVLGKRAWFDDQFLRVIGVLPPNFEFASRRVRHYVPLIRSPLPAGMMVKLRKETSLESAQDTLRQIALRIEQGWKREAYRLQPYLQDVRWRDTAIPAVLVAVPCWIAGLIFLFRKMRSPQYFAALLVRFLLSLLAVSQLFGVIALWSAANLIPLAIFLLWFYVVVCVTVSILTIRDHLNRCPVCLSRLRMPTSVGTWGSLMMDLPGTGYVCPRGHGWLHCDGRGSGRSQWNRLDSTWRDLFVP